MKSGGPLQRRKGLDRGPGPARGTPLPGGGVLARRTELRSRGAAPRGEPGPPSPRPRRPSKSPDTPQTTREVVYLRDDDMCARCGRPAPRGNRQVQHRVPRGSGGRRDGAHRLSALVLLCGRSSTDPEGCHWWAESQVTAAQVAGFRVEMDVDPLTVPVSWWDGRCYLLDDHGDRHLVAAREDEGSPG